MNMAIFAKDCRPLPPTPKSKAFPIGWRIILTILEICSQASWNKTSLRAFLPLVPENFGSELYYY